MILILFSLLMLITPASTTTYSESKLVDTYFESFKTEAPGLSEWDIEGKLYALCMTATAHNSDPHLLLLALNNQVAAQAKYCRTRLNKFDYKKLGIGIGLLSLNALILGGVYLNLQSCSDLMLQTAQALRAKNLVFTGSPLEKASTTMKDIMGLTKSLAFFACLKPLKHIIQGLGPTYKEEYRYWCLVYEKINKINRVINPTSKDIPNMLEDDEHCDKLVDELKKIE